MAGTVALEANLVLERGRRMTGGCGQEPVVTHGRVESVVMLRVSHAAVVRVRAHLAPLPTHHFSPGRHVRHVPNGQLPPDGRPSLTLLAPFRHSSWMLLVVMDSDVMNWTVTGPGFAIDGRRWCWNGLVRLRLEGVVMMMKGAGARRIGRDQVRRETVARAAVAHQDGLVDPGGGAQVENGCLDESQGHFAVHLLLGDPVPVPVDEEEDGPRPRHLRR